MTMTPTIYFIIVCICIAIFVTLFCQPVLREEDRLSKEDPNVDIYTGSKPLIILSWFSIVLLGFLLFQLRFSLKAEMIGGCIAILGMLLIAAIAYAKRTTYFRLDNNTFKLIYHGEVAWSHRWDEISCINRRIVSTGKTTHAYLDVICKDGTIHKNIPNAMSKMIGKHIKVTRYPTNWKVFSIVMFLIIVSILVFVLLNV